MIHLLPLVPFGSGLLATFIADLFKPPRRLEVENLFLRHQLNVALRRTATAIGTTVAARAGTRRRDSQSLPSLGERSWTCSRLGEFQLNSNGNRIACRKCLLERLVEEFIEMFHYGWRRLVEKLCDQHEWDSFLVRSCDRSTAKGNAQDGKNTRRGNGEAAQPHDDQR